MTCILATPNLNPLNLLRLIKLVVFAQTQGTTKMIRIEEGGCALQVAA